jgi:hypothetical protein
MKVILSRNDVRSVPPVRNTSNGIIPAFAVPPQMDSNELVGVVQQCYYSESELGVTQSRH